MNLKRKLELEREKLAMVMLPKEPRECTTCGMKFEPVTNKQRHCSNECWTKDKIN